MVLFILLAIRVYFRFLAKQQRPSWMHLFYIY
jgi:hypothetical protein